jgi:hypothetical protein
LLAGGDLRRCGIDVDQLAVERGELRVLADDFVDGSCGLRAIQRLPGRGYKL